MRSATGRAAQPRRHAQNSPSKLPRTHGELMLSIWLRNRDITMHAARRLVRRRLWAAGCGLWAAGCRRRAASCQLPTISCNGIHAGHVCLWRSDCRWHAGISLATSLIAKVCNNRRRARHTHCAALNTVLTTRPAPTLRSAQRASAGRTIYTHVETASWPRPRLLTIQRTPITLCGAPHDHLR